MTKAVLLFCTPFVLANALYNGNPEYPTIVDEGLFFNKDSNFTLDVGYQKDWVFDYKFNVENLVDSTFSRATSVMDQGLINVNLFENYQVYATLGAAMFEFDQTLRSDDVVSYTTKDSFTFGVGGKILIYQGHGFSLGIDGKYQYACPSISTITKDGAYVPQTSKADVTFYAWQIAAAVAYRIDMFSPYIGINYLNQKAHFKNLDEGIVSPADTDFYAKGSIPVGGIIGFTISSSRDFSVTVESRIIDENAITLLLDLKF
jgi:hypothetical protein